EKLADDEHIDERDEDRVADKSRGVRERRAIGRGDRIVVPPQPSAARGLHKKTEEAGHEEDKAQEKPGSFLDPRDRPRHHPRSMAARCTTSSSAEGPFMTARAVHRTRPTSQLMRFGSPGPGRARVR